MFEHLEKAGIFLNDTEHLQRIDEFFNDSYLILKNNVMIGVIKLGLFPERIHIRQFQILPQHQGTGIGNKVLDVVKKKAKERQCGITLNVLLDNPAKILYLRHGFVVVSQNELEFHMQWFTA